MLNLDLLLTMPQCTFLCVVLCPLPLQIHCSYYVNSCNILKCVVSIKQRYALCWKDNSFVFFCFHNGGVSCSFSKRMVNMIMPLSLFGLKFLEWWYSSEQSDVVRKVTSLPVPPPPGRIKVCIFHSIISILNIVMSSNGSFHSIIFHLLNRPSTYLHILFLLHSLNTTTQS